MVAKGIVEAGDHQHALDAARHPGLPAAALGIVAVLFPVARRLVPVERPVGAAIAETAT